MEVDTGQFAAIRDRVDGLEAEVADLRRAVVLREVFVEEVEDRAFARGRASVLGRRAGLRSRHLRAVDGGLP